jgi:hypothetical protein
MIYMTFFTQETQRTKVQKTFDILLMKFAAAAAPPSRVILTKTVTATALGAVRLR